MGFIRRSVEFIRDPRHARNTLLVGAFAAAGSIAVMEAMGDFPSQTTMLVLGSVCVAQTIAAAERQHAATLQAQFEAARGDILGVGPK